MILKTIAVIALFITVDAYSQNPARPMKKAKTRKVLGISEPLPLSDKDRQLRWYVKWIAQDKVPFLELTGFQTLLKEKQEPWKKALDREKMKKTPRERYVAYYDKHVKWYDDMIDCVNVLYTSKTGILSINNNPEPAYAKKQKKLEADIKETLEKFKKTVLNRPKVLRTKR